MNLAKEKLLDAISTQTGSTVNYRTLINGEEIHFYIPNLNAAVMVMPSRNFTYDKKNLVAEGHLMMRYYTSLPQKFSCVVFLHEETVRTFMKTPEKLQTFV